MTSVETFITVGNYLAAPILISAGLTFSALIEWFELGRSKRRLVTSDRPVVTALASMGLCHVLGAILLAALGRIDTAKPLWVSARADEVPDARLTTDCLDCCSTTFRALWVCSSF